MNCTSFIFQPPVGSFLWFLCRRSQPRSKDKHLRRRLQGATVDTHDSSRSGLDSVLCCWRMYFVGNICPRL